ncbi:hypothetical protein [Nostoc sp.]|uniref:hypothetical protein n=1 Tax=Nostoc sp. TaxID=1180 RepID=UPI002FEF7CA7
MIFIYISSNVTIAVLFSIAILVKRQKKRELLTKVSRYSYFVLILNCPPYRIWRMLRTIAECIYLTQPD